MLSRRLGTQDPKISPASLRIRKYNYLVIIQTNSHFLSGMESPSLQTEEAQLTPLPFYINSRVQTNDINYLLLCNKLRPNLVVLYKHLLSAGFWGSDLGAAQLSGGGPGSPRQLQPRFWPRRQPPESSAGTRGSIPRIVSPVAIGRRPRSSASGPLHGVCLKQAVAFPRARWGESAGGHSVCLSFLYRLRTSTSSFLQTSPHSRGKESDCIF